MQISPTLFKSAACLLIGLSAVVLSRPADAVMIVDATESGGNVVFDYTGTLNTSTLPVMGNVWGPSSAVLEASSPMFYSTSPGTFDIYRTSSSFAAFGPGYSRHSSSSLSGDAFGFSYGYFTGGGEVFVPRFYASGTSLSGSATFTGESFSSLGMTTGTYVNTLSNNDTITLNVGTAAVPGPLPILGIPPALLFSRKLKARIRARRNISNSALA